jgi:hypothetical protein
MSAITRLTETGDLLSEAGYACDRINNLLTGITLRAGLMLKECQEESTRRRLVEIVEAGSEAGRHSQRMQRSIFDRERTNS